MRANMRSHVVVGLVVAGASLATHAQAQCPGAFDGATLQLSIKGKQRGPQRILVLPVVDSTYAYDPASRRFSGTSLEPNLAQIISEYQTNRDFWAEASYDNVTLDAVVPECFYQVSGQFPTSGEAPFQRASLISTANSSFDISYSSFTVTYVADPAEGEKSVTFTSDAGTMFASPEELVADLRAQLGAAANDLEVEAAIDGFQYSLVFQVLEERTFAGSKVDVDFGASDPASRKNLGLVQPSFSQTAPGTVQVTTDGAVLPGNGYEENGASLLFEFRGAGDEYDSQYWTWSGSCTSGATGCPMWQNASELLPWLTPNDGPSAATILDTTVLGRPELIFQLQVNASQTYTKADINDNYALGKLSDSMQAELGLASMKTQLGTASAIDLQFGSHEITAEGLKSFLIQELTGPDAGCLGVGNELQLDSTNPDPALALKAAADAYLGTFSAIHVYLLSSADTRRDNASNTTLCAEIPLGGTTATYKIHSPVALVELSSGVGTIAHETGHNIGFPDLYDNSNTWFSDIPSDYHPNLTFPGRWDVMADSDDAISHPSSFTKQWAHGWLNDGAGTDNGTVAQVNPGDPAKTFLLTPLERPRASYDNQIAAMPDVTIAKMIVLPFGNVSTANAYLPGHFLAVENRQAGVQFSQELPDFQSEIGKFGGVRVSDNISDLNINPSQIKPIARNYSHSLTPGGPTYPDRDGRAIAVGTALATTQTFPSYPGVSVENIGLVPAPGDPENDPPSYLVRVTYTATETVDLRIKPWLAPTQYASNAIWFEPATSAEPPASPAIPDQNSSDPVAVGNVNAPLWLADYEGPTPLNWIHVLVENAGTFNVENVRVKATFNSPGGAGAAAAWKPVTPDAYSLPKSIPAGGSAVLSIPWNPDEELAADGHTCVAVEVVDWNVQGNLGQVADINPFDNVAQENIHAMVMKSESPWQDVPFRFEVHNNYAHEVPVEVEPVGLRPGYRVTMAQTRLNLSAGTSHVFEGTFSWDSSTIPTPPNQDPDDPYWEVCESDTPTDPIETTYEAESLGSSVGYEVEGGWVLDEVGFMATSHNFESGPTLITIPAAGSALNEIWPHMQLWVGNVLVGEVDVTGGYIEDYEFAFDATAGVQQIRLVLTNGEQDGYWFRALLLDEIHVQTYVPPAHCGGIWGLVAYARLGDFRVPLGGSSFAAEAKPIGVLDTTTTVNPLTGDITVSGQVTPPHPGQDVRIYVRYPSGVVDIIETTTGPGGTCTTTFTPKERGPVTVSTELPRGGGPFAPTPPEVVELQACIPASVGTCNDGIKNQGETGVDCGGPCPACVVPCTISNAIDLGAPGVNKTVPIDGCVKVQSGYPSWWGTRAMRLESAAGGAYPVPFTWSNTCSGSSGSGTFTANWQSKVLNVTKQTCATLIDLNGTGSGNITLRYWAN